MGALDHLQGALVTKLGGYLPDSLLKELKGTDTVDSEPGLTRAGSRFGGRILEDAGSKKEGCGGAPRRGILDPVDGAGREFSPIDGKFKLSCSSSSLTWGADWMSWERSLVPRRVWRRRRERVGFSNGFWWSLVEPSGCALDSGWSCE